MITNHIPVDIATIHAVQTSYYSHISVAYTQNHIKFNPLVYSSFMCSRPLMYYYVYNHIMYQMHKVLID